MQLYRKGIATNFSYKNNDNLFQIFKWLHDVQAIGVDPLF